MTRRARPRMEALESAIERIDESGLLPPILIVALVVGFFLLGMRLRGSAHAAPVDARPTPSDLAGVLVALVPIVMAVICMCFALRGTPPRQADDEAYGDTTGLGEQEQ